MAISNSEYVEPIDCTHWPWPGLLVPGTERVGALAGERRLVRRVRREPRVGRHVVRQAAQRVGVGREEHDLGHRRQLRVVVLLGRLGPEGLEVRRQRGVGEEVAARAALATGLEQSGSSRCSPSSGPCTRRRRRSCSHRSGRSRRPSEGTPHAGRCRPRRSGTSGPRWCCTWSSSGRAATSARRCPRTGGHRRRTSSCTSARCPRPRPEVRSTRRRIRPTRPPTGRPSRGTAPCTARTSWRPGSSSRAPSSSGSGPTPELISSWVTWTATLPRDWVSFSVISIL